MFLFLGVPGVLAVVFSGLSGQTLPGDCLHYFAESIQLAKSCVDIWRNPNALELFMNNRSGKNPVFIE
jgi:hypothetical protein